MVLKKKRKQRETSLCADASQDLGDDVLEAVCNVEGTLTIPLVFILKDLVTDIFFEDLKTIFVWVVQLCIALLWAVGKFCAANLCEIAAFFSGSFDADDAELPQIRIHLTKTETSFGFVDGSNPDCLTKT